MKQRNSSSTQQYSGSAGGVEGERVHRPTAQWEAGGARVDGRRGDDVATAAVAAAAAAAVFFAHEPEVAIKSAAVGSQPHIPGSRPTLRRPITWFIH